VGEQIVPGNAIQISIGFIVGSAEAFNVRLCTGTTISGYALA